MELLNYCYDWGSSLNVRKWQNAIFILSLLMSWNKKPLRCRRHRRSIIVFIVACLCHSGARCWLVGPKLALGSFAIGHSEDLDSSSKKDEKPKPDPRNGSLPPEALSRASLRLNSSCMSPPLVKPSRKQKNVFIIHENWCRLKPKKPNPAIRVIAVSLEISQTIFVDNISQARRASTIRHNLWVRRVRLRMLQSNESVCDFDSV